MAEIYRMPSISPTMEVGTLVEWKLEVGQSFEAGTAIAEVGTDKATMEAEVFEEGVLLALVAEEGDDIPVDAPMAILGTQADEDVSELLAQAKAELKAAMAKAEAGESADDGGADGSGAPAEPEAAPAPPPAVKAAPVEVSSARTWHGETLSPLFADPPGDLRLGAAGPRVFASPLARKVADDLGLDLRRVKGSGPGGRIVRDDVEQASKAPAAASPMAGAPREDTTVKLTQMRRTIAKRLLQSHQDIPTFFLTVTFDMQAMVDLRAQLKAQLPDVRVSYNDMVVAAVARALRDVPEANASWEGKSIVQHGAVDVGIAVALDEGLITPVLRDADQMRLSQIGAATRDLAGRAREGTLSPEEYTGNTFTLSNLGMYGIEHFTAIINPPASGILAVGALEQRPVVVDGELTVGWRMSATMTCDHRVIDGAVGATFLQALRRYVEAPALLLV